MAKFMGGGVKPRKTKNTGWINDWIECPCCGEKYLYRNRYVLEDHIIQEHSLFEPPAHFPNAYALYINRMKDRLEKTKVQQEYNSLIQEIKIHLTSGKKIYEYFGLTIPQNTLALPHLDITELLPFDTYCRHTDRANELKKRVKNELLKILHKQCTKIVIANRTFIRQKYDIYRMENGEHILVYSNGMINNNELPQAFKKICLYIYETQDNIITQWDWSMPKKKKVITIKTTNSQKPII